MNDSRLLGFASVTLVIAFLLSWRLYSIQVIQHDELLYQAQRRQFGEELLPSGRGMIYDRSMTVLAYSKPYTAFYVSVKQANKTSEKIIKSFAKVTGKSPEHYRGFFSTRESRIILEKTTGDIALQLKAINYDGLSYQEEPQRIYPYNTLAAHILGYTDKKSFCGMDGIEKECDTILKGAAGKRTILRDPMGNMIASLEDEAVQANPGDNVILTIDKNIQETLEEELGKTVTEFDAKSGCGIIMNPQNGEIIAIANVRTYNPNSYGSYPDSIRRNLCISDMYEPGSTFKGITLTSLIEKNLVRESEVIPVNGGVYKLPGITITDSHGANELSVEDVFAHSSNIGMAKLSTRISKDELYKYIRAFGFGSQTQVELPAEANGGLDIPGKWDRVQNYTIAYGYGVLVTPLQMVSAYSAMINGGTLYQPHIIKKIVTPSGDLVKDNIPVAIRRVISRETSDRMKKLCVRVIEQGTGELAKINGVEVGGKTGTARILVNKVYSNKEYNASFIGFFPASKPKYIGIILVKSPRSNIFGGSVAAPAFKRVALKIIAGDSELKGLLKSNKGDSKIAETPQVFRQVSPVSTNPIQPAPVKLAANMKIDPLTMPDLTELSIRDAVFIAKKLNLQYRISGYGKVLSQSIDAGRRIRKGEVCFIKGISQSDMGRF